MLIAAQRAGFVGAVPWPAALLVWGPGAVSSSHSHHAVQLVLALTGRIRIRPRPRARWGDCGAVVIAPDTSHEVDARGSLVLIGFIDPESELVVALIGQVGDEMIPVSDSVVARWRRALGDPHTLDPRRVEAWLRSELLDESSPRRIHPRVRRVLRYLRQQGLDRHETSLTRLAGIAQLSPSRFMHIFTDSLGVPLRPYLLWLRVQRAAGALATGHTVTEAAHIAGFADAAHMTRTFRRTLGTTPRELIRRAPATHELWVEPRRSSQFVQDPIVGR